MARSSADFVLTRDHVDALCALVTRSRSSLPCTCPRCKGSVDMTLMRIPNVGPYGPDFHVCPACADELEDERDEAPHPDVTVWCGARRRS